MAAVAIACRCGCPGRGSPTVSEATARVRVLIVDDDPLVRSALRMMLGADPLIEVIGEAADGAQAVDAVRSRRPDVALMDIRMPVLDGIEATARIMAMPSGPDDVRTQVIVLTTFDADELVRAAIRAGASGFLLKHTSPERLLSAVHRVVAGEPMLSPSVTRQMMSLVAAADADPRRAAARADLAGLSERERQVALAIGQGKSNAEIAAELYLSVATVKSHVTHLLTRWDVTNRVQIAIRVHDAGLI
ncbi:MAG: response regulator transcription factor [Kineosporiaceae bacterium]|nr:response regulator transcription factor [Kineosporiaceae bacterium]